MWHACLFALIRHMFYTWKPSHFPAMCGCCGVKLLGWLTAHPSPLYRWPFWYRGIWISISCNQNNVGLCFCVCCSPPLHLGVYFWSFWSSLALSVAISVHALSHTVVADELLENWMHVILLPSMVLECIAFMSLFYHPLDVSCWTFYRTNLKNSGYTLTHLYSMDLLNIVKFHLSSDRWWFLSLCVRLLVCTAAELFSPALMQPVGSTPLAQT